MDREMMLATLADQLNDPQHIILDHGEGERRDVGKWGGIEEPYDEGVRLAQRSADAFKKALLQTSE